MSEPLADPSPAMRKLLARIRRRGESGLAAELAPFNTARALLNRGLIERSWTISGLYYFAEKAEPLRNCVGCRKPVRVFWNTCQGCKKIVCVRCALRRGHTANGEHR